MKTHKVIKIYNGDETTMFKGTYQQCKTELAKLKPVFDYDDEYDDEPRENAIAYNYDIVDINHKNTGIKIKDVLLFLFVIILIYGVISEFGSVIFYVLGGGGIRQNYETEND